MKNLNKIRRGSGFRGVLNYLQENADSTKTGAHVPGRLIGGTMSGANPRDLAAEFGIARRLRPDVRKPVWHNALRLPPGDTLSDEQWKEIADRHCELMGFDLSKNQVCYWLHPDEQAVHIIASRIGLDGSLYYGQNENLINTKSTQQIEREFGLQITIGPELSPTGRPKEKDRRELKKGEIEMALRTGYQPSRVQLQNAIDAAIAKARDMDDFRTALEKSGVTVHVHPHPETGAARGMSFEIDGIRFSGSQLGADYKFKKIEERIKHHDHAEKDRAGARPAIADRGQRIDPSGGRLVARSASDQEKAGGPRPPIGHTGEAHRADGRADGEKEKGAAASRNDANPKGENQMNIFKKKTATAPAPVAGRDFQDVVPRGAYGGLASGIPSIPGLPASDRTTPPTLSGRLMPVRLSSGRGMDYDLFWKDRQDGKASFRWQGEQQRLLILAQPSEKNVSALFDAAAEKGIGMPLVEITGSPDFQRLAAAEAARRGLPVDTSKLSDDAARELYRQTWDRAHGEAANSIAAAAYESDDREDARRAAEKQRQQQELEKNAARDGDDDHRGPSAGRPKG